ncbi:hypothetical protein Golomagni_06338, partial [Golovinomyces magnicellulatus]
PSQLIAYKLITNCKHSIRQLVSVSKSDCPLSSYKISSKNQHYGKSISGTVKSGSIMELLIMDDYRPPTQTAKSPLAHLPTWIVLILDIIGQPSNDPGSVQQVRYGQSNGGLVVMSDVQTVEVLAHFARERIPERMVHSKAAGAFGEWEVIADVSDLTDAKFLTGIGKKTSLLTRISTVGGEKGSSDTVRDVRGWATKLYTEDGIQDFVFNDLPVFFIRDPIKFPSMNRSHKKHPRTNVPDNSMFWDYHLNNPEGMHALMHLFGQRGIPASLRHINGFGVHTYTLNKADGSYVYVKWHFKPDEGIQTMDSDTAMLLAGSQPDYHIKDLFNAIERGDYPSWTVYIQVMKPEEVKDAPIDIFDDTFTWPHEQYPLRPIARFHLNGNPNNYFEDIEQACFSPSNMVPGIGPSADPGKYQGCSKLECSATPTLIATVSVPTTSSCHPTDQPTKFTPHIYGMVPEHLMATTERTPITSTLSFAL